MKVPPKLSRFLGSISAHSYITKKPLWYIWKPELHKVKGTEIREIINQMLPGDVLFRRYDGYLNTYFTPGFWAHAALVISKQYIIHSVGKGVLKEDILDFCRTDNVALSRLKNVSSDTINHAIKTAEKMVEDKIEYDFALKDKNDKMYCTEFVNECYQGLFYDSYTNVMGNYMLLPDPLMENKNLETIIEIRH